MAQGSQAAVRSLLIAIALACCIIRAQAAALPKPHGQGVSDVHLRLRSAIPDAFPDPFPIENVDTATLTAEADADSKPEAKGFFSDLGKFLGEYSGFDILRDFFRSIMTGEEDRDGEETETTGSTTGDTTETTFATLSRSNDSATTASETLETIYLTAENSTDDTSPTTATTGDDSTLTPSGIAQNIISEILAGTEATITSDGSTAVVIARPTRRVRVRTSTLVVSTVSTVSTTETSVETVPSIVETAIPASESDIVFSILPIIPVSENGTVGATTATTTVAVNVTSELPIFSILPVLTTEVGSEASSVVLFDSSSSVGSEASVGGTSLPIAWAGNATSTSEKPWLLTNPLRPTTTETISEDPFILTDIPLPTSTDLISKKSWTLTNPLRPTGIVSWNFTFSANETGATTAWMTSTSTLFVTVTGDLLDIESLITALPIPSASSFNNRLAVTDAPFGPYHTISEADHNENEEQTATAAITSSYTSTIPLLLPFPSPVHPNETTANITTAPGLSSLRRICSDPEIKTITLPLIKHFYGPNSYPSLNRFPGCTTANSRQALQAPGLLDCSMLGEEIVKCQKTGRKVLLSIKGDGVEAVQGNVDYGRPGLSLQPFGPYFNGASKASSSSSSESSDDTSSPSEYEDSSGNDDDDNTTNNSNRKTKLSAPDNEEDTELNANPHGENDKTHKKLPLNTNANTNTHATSPTSSNGNTNAHTNANANAEQTNHAPNLHPHLHRRARPWNNTFKPIPNLFTESRPPSSLALTFFSLFGEGHTERADLRPFGPDTPSSVSPDSIKWLNRPLGEEVVVDGFDVQLPREWKGTYQAERFDDLVTRLRELHEEAWKEGGGEEGGKMDLGADGKGVVYFDYIE